MLEGLPPNGATHLLRLHCDCGHARALADVISETFDSGDTAAAAFQRDPSAAEGAEADWVLEVYFRLAPDETMVRQLIASSCGQAAADAACFDSIAQKDWVEATLAGIAPVRAGRFLIGSGRSSVARHNDLVLAIPAALAFGTGHHGTTIGCLLNLEAICRTRRPRRILDVGTGTGILALAAAKLLRVPVACSDVDPTAVTIAAENAQRNDAARLVRPVLAHGARHPRLRARAPYDLIFANILARPLRLLARSLCLLASPAADLVLSGLLPRDVPGVLSSYAAQGFALARRRDIDGWTTLLMRRHGAAARPLERSSWAPAARSWMLPRPVHRRWCTARLSTVHHAPLFRRRFLQHQAKPN
jgi:ribosomal protein L11 methyltransferase